MCAKYAPLIASFVDHQISAREFESRYLTLFKNDRDQVRSREFNILDRLFADVDEYTADPDLRRRVGGLDDQELRTCAREAYRKLRET
ncbi:colicin immunity domain-containing protein [Mycobacterium sp. E2327]|uniref:colicin immunity domain-containing protein n=1 Tax=Mycobacterium sp. E2327 TaxID=1834132 RepID=UPI0009ED0DC4